ncbi:MAG TPA: ABC transporter ATP-binding protein [Ferruginibacter sp.]|nr:ABC transporter ATP-binding protein [Ferruginibacter sp.]HMP21266.1 ABC transporter ATP-binding protein [Ferruginibacter sp.]
MLSLAIKAEHISKAYQLGVIGTGTLSKDIERRIARMRGKEDPFLKIGEINDRAVAGKSDVVWSLKDISFEIKKGEAVGVIGRNGAGKSTLLKILSRVTTPTAGTIKARGRIASLLEVGTGFHPDLTGRENIFLNGAILGMTKKEIAARFDEIVAFSGVERYVDTPVKRYSSGMYVRLAFAVAAHLESEILIVDEVLAVGDAEFQRKAIGKMQETAAGGGRTVLFVSHNLASIRALCTSGLLMHNGCLQYQGDIGTVIERYSSLLHTGEVMKMQGSFAADADRQAQFNSVQLQRNGQPMGDNGVIDVFDKLSLKLSFTVRKTIYDSTPIIWVKKDNVDLYWTFLSDATPDILKNGIAPGDYTYEVPLLHPLKKGMYSITIMLGKLRVMDYHKAENVIQFQVEETSFDPTIHSFSANRAGIIANLTSWIRI